MIKPGRASRCSWTHLGGSTMRRAFFILAFLLPAAVLAQPGRFEITPFAGYRLNGDFDAQSSDVFDPDLNIEIEANRQRSAFIIDRGLLEPSRELGDVDLTIVHAGLLLQWGEGQVNPFVTISGGLTRIDPQFSELDADNRFSTSFGGGAKVFFSENVGLRLEARGFWTDLDTGFEDRFDRYDSGDGLFQGEASAGLIIA